MMYGMYMASRAAAVSEQNLQRSRVRSVNSGDLLNSIDPSKIEKLD